MEANVGATNHPATWEYKHSSVFTVYRIYYRGATVEPNVFPAVPPEIAETPAKKNAVIVAKTEKVSPKAARAISAKHAVVDTFINGNEGELAFEGRIALLTEIKLHAELLGAFQGVMPDAEIAERKRALYEALPHPPKKFKVAEAEVAEAEVAEAEV